MEIKNFACFKVTEKKNDKEPDYRLSMNYGSKEQPMYTEIGAGWVKEGQAGKFIAFTLKNAFKDKKGYHIEEDTAVEGSGGDVEF